MDPITIRHLRDSAALIPTADHGAAEEFYRRLFELAPEVRPLFSREIGMQAKKFSEMLAWVIAHLEQPDELVAELRKLGTRTLSSAARWSEVFGMRRRKSSCS